MKGELNTNAMPNAAKTDTDFWNTQRKLIE